MKTVSSPISARATTLLTEILETYAYRNLDDLDAFKGRNSTTEVLAKEIHDRYAAGIRVGRLDGDADKAIVSAIRGPAGKIRMPGPGMMRR